MLQYAGTELTVSDRELTESSSRCWKIKMGGSLNLTENNIFNDRGTKLG